MMPMLWMILGTVIVFFLSALPLHLAVKIFGGETNIFKTMIVMFLGGLLVAVVRSATGIFGGILSFIVLLWLYRVTFDLGWISAFLVWILQFVIVAVFFVIAIMIFGVSVISQSLL